MIVFLLWMIGVIISYAVLHYRWKKSGEGLDERHKRMSVYFVLALIWPLTWLMVIVIFYDQDCNR